MKLSTTNVLTAALFILMGLAFASGGILAGESDDAPGAAQLGFLLMSAMVFLAVRAWRRKA